MEQERGFFGSLFDFSFTSFVTTKIIKVLYGLLIAGAVVFSLVLIVGSFSDSPGAGVFMLVIGAPLFFFIAVLYARVVLELIIVVFRIADHTAEIAELGRSGLSE